MVVGLLFFFLVFSFAQRSSFFLFIDEGIQILDPQLQSVINTISQPEFPVSWDEPSILVTYPDPDLPEYSKTYIIVNSSSYSLLMTADTRMLDFIRSADSDPFFGNRWDSPLLGDHYLILPDSSDPASLVLFDTLSDTEKSLTLAAPIQHALWVPADTSPLTSSSTATVQSMVMGSSVAEVAPADSCSPNTNCVGCVNRNSTIYCPNPGACGYDPIVQCGSDCMDGMGMPNCPYPGACGYKGQPGCVDCKSGASTTNCPDPSKCGFASIPQCTNCMSSMCMDGCPWPQLCPTQCPGCKPPADCAQCMPGYKMPGCPDANACNVGPVTCTYNTQCVECQPRNSTQYCPNPGYCGYDPIVPCGSDCMDNMAMQNCPFPGACGFKGQTGCVGCVSGVATSGCPDPAKCGFAPIPSCNGCKSGMCINGCPWPQLCPNECPGCTGPPECADCMAGMPMPGCPDPSKCGVTYYNTDCVQCMDRMAMPYCQDPGKCGFDPIVNCTDCMSGMAMPECQFPAACGPQYVGQKGCVNCTSRVSEPTCVDPGSCGFAYIPQCDGCKSGVWTLGCPYPDHCGPQYGPLPDCGGCVAGQPSSTCPNPNLCGLKPLCDDCMCNMFMSTCPDPAACGFVCNDTCMMESTFGFSHDVCILFSSWHVTDTGAYVGAVFAVLAVCVVREWLSVHRMWVANKCKPGLDKVPINSMAETSDGEAVGSKASVRCQNNAINALWYLCGLLAAYILMLVVMTYEAGFFITVIVGCGISHFLFHLLYGN